MIWSTIAFSSKVSERALSAQLVDHVAALLARA
jgi:hypothetical protein